jgi:hypothetical protein
MSRPPTEVGKAIRVLLDKHQGQITHLEAVPMLREMGIKVPDPQKDPKGFKKSQTGFNSAGYQWRKEHEGKSTQKPSAKKTKVVKTKSVKKVTARKATVKVRKVGMNSDEALRFIKSEGGMKSAKAKLQKLETAINQLTAFTAAISQVG